MKATARGMPADHTGQKTGVKVWNGTTASYDVSYQYYANGWLKAVKYGGSTIASYSYDAVGNRTQIDYGNGTFTKFDYEATGPRYRLETITHKYGATELAKFGYTRDDVGNPLSISWRQNSTTFEWEYDYDAMNRLASAAPPDEGPLLPLPAQAGGTYAYDWVGNMKAAATSNPWSYNAADQLTLWPGMHSYSYDGNGALTAVKTADGRTEQRSFTYHPSGLMNEAEFNGQTLTNLWDADEHRVQFSIGEDEYTAVFDVTAGIPAVIAEQQPDESYVYYVCEPGGELLCRVVTVGETTHKWYYHFDELGSTRLITDGSGAVTDRYAYDAYGAVIAHDRDAGTIDQPYQYVGQLGYYTHYQAPELGWLQLGVRFYQPETGRFERRDPLVWSVAAAASAYPARPLSLIDPSGQVAWDHLRKAGVDYFVWEPILAYENGQTFRQCMIECLGWPFVCTTGVAGAIGAAGKPLDKEGWFVKRWYKLWHHRLFARGKDRGLPIRAVPGVGNPIADFWKGIQLPGSKRLYWGNGSVAVLLGGATGWSLGSISRCLGRCL